jgi:hypothetical protein
LVNSALKQLSGTISILKAGSHNGEVDSARAPAIPGHGEAGLKFDWRSP